MLQTKKNIIEFIQDKNRVKKYILTLLILIFVTFAFFSDYGIINTIKLQHTQSILNKQIAEENRITDSLKNHIHRLQTDTLFIERVAREKYGLVKPGETVFIIQEEE